MMVAISTRIGNEAAATVTACQGRIAVTVEEADDGTCTINLRRNSKTILRHVEPPQSK